MSVEIEPVNKGCDCIGVANGTWFTLLNEAGLGTVVAGKNTNDPVNATEEQANECADLLEKWTPPAGWFLGGEEEKGKELFLDFFRECGGFTTY